MGYHPIWALEDVWTGMLKIDQIFWAFNCLRAGVWGFPQCLCYNPQFLPVREDGCPSSFPQIVPQLDHVWSLLVLESYFIEKKLPKLNSSVSRYWKKNPHSFILKKLPTIKCHLIHILCKILLWRVRYSSVFLSSFWNTFVEVLFFHCEGRFTMEET